MKMQRDAILGFKKSRQVLEEKLVSNKEFYWVIPCKDDKEFMKISKKAIRAELRIKEFYKTIFKTINGINRIANKGGKWIKVAKKMLVKSRISEQDPKTMSDEDFKEHLKITDKKEMEKLLSGELITIKII